MKSNQQRESDKTSNTYTYITASTCLVYLRLSQSLCYGFLILVSGKSVNAVDAGGVHTTAADFLDDGCGTGDGLVRN